jgi:hypothetical protein
MVFLPFAVWIVGAGGLGRRDRIRIAAASGRRRSEVRENSQALDACDRFLPSDDANDPRHPNRQSIE